MEQKRIAVVSQKGGVGKSTLCRMVAVNFAGAGWAVKIADLDLLQGSCISWNRRRLASGIEPEVSVESFADVRRAIRASEGYDLVLFDGAPHSSKITLTAALESDLAVIPTGTSVDDMEPAVLLAHDLVAGGVPRNRIAIAFSRIGDSAAELQEAKEYMSVAGYSALPGTIREKTAIRRAQDAGKCATETSFQSVNETADELLQSIVNRIT